MYIFHSIYQSMHHTLARVPATVCRGKYFLTVKTYNFYLPRLSYDCDTLFLTQLLAAD